MKNLLTSEDAHWTETWQAVCRLIEQEASIPAHSMQRWVETLQFVEVSENGADLFIRAGAPNQFTADYVSSRYAQPLRAAFERITGKNTVIEFLPLEDSDSPTETLQDPVLEPQQSPRTGAQSGGYSGASLAAGFETPPPAPEPRHGTVLWGANSRASQAFDPRYTFETFVVGASNQFAHASAYAVSEKPGQQYNPLFLFSAPGLGKTHLLHAIANHVLARNPATRVLYISAEKFLNELIESLRDNRMSQFRQKYRESFDLLLVDDIQFIAGKEKTEEEFFHTFNALHENKRQLVITSDRPPKEIQGLEERLRTRFEWGLIADISIPEIETRIAILKGKAERDDIYLPDEVATFLATYIKSNVRELEGVLIKLQAHASITGAELSLELAKQHLKLVVPAEEGSQYTIENILAAVAKHFRLKAADFKSNSKQRSVARPRQIAMYLIRKYTNLGYKEIGLYFGGRDHTTIMHACREIEKKLDADEEVREAVESVQNLL